MNLIQIPLIHLLEMSNFVLEVNELQNEQFLKTGQVAKILNVSRDTIQDWVKKGIIVPHHTDSNGYNFFIEKQLVDFCKNKANLLTDSKNWGTSSNIRKQTSAKLQNTFKSVSIVPIQSLTITNDKLSKVLFTRSQEEYCNILKCGGEILEKTLPKLGEIITPYWLELIDEYTDKTPLNMFDKAILTVCSSELLSGNKFSTPNIIYRHITGKDDGENFEPPPLIIEAILFSIRKMMCTRITVDMSDACKHLHYNDGQPLKIVAPILPCQYTTGVFINGQKVGTVIEFYKESPLLTVARAKNHQLLTLEPKLLKVPHQNNSGNNISIRHYVIQRVLEIKQHNLLPRITFEDVFQKCNLSNATKKQKFLARSSIIDIFHFLKNGNDISSFTIQKLGNKFHAIDFTFNPSSHM